MIKEVRGTMLPGGLTYQFGGTNPIYVQQSSSFCCAFPAVINLTQGRLTAYDGDADDAYNFVLWHAKRLGRPVMLTVTEHQKPFFELFTTCPYASFVRVVETQMEPKGSYKVALVIIEVKEDKDDTATQWQNRYPASFQVGV